MEKFKSFMIQIALYPIVFNSLFAKLVFRKQLVLLFYYYYYYYYFGGRGVDGEVRQKAKLKLPNKKKKHLFLKFQF